MCHYPNRPTETARFVKRSPLHEYPYGTDCISVLFIAALITVLSHPGALMHFCSLVRSGRRGSRGGGGQTNAIGGSSVVFLVFLVVLRRDARSLAHQHGAQLGSLPSGLEAGTEI